MTLIQENKVIPAVAEKNETITIAVKCDFCGIAYDNARACTYDGDVSFARNYNVENVGLYLKKGTSYPEGSEGSIQQFHGCKKCWYEKIVPALKAMGGIIHVTEYDY